jgi:tetratricopeptide (TPR) repeat protein
MEIGGGAAPGYEMVLRGPDGGEVSGPLSLPAQELELLAARVPDAVIASSARGRWQPTTREERLVRDLGTTLFNATLGGAQRGMFATCRRQADLAGQALRVTLQIRPPEPARLPWEFLFDSEEDEYVGLSAALVRCPVTPVGVRPLRVDGPLRLLGMASLPGDLPELAAAAERERMTAALAPLVEAGRVELDWVAGQSWRDLQAKVRDGGWHVLHFIGHGSFDTLADEGKLLLANEDGDGIDLLGAGDLANMLRDEGTLRLVVLNACETGRSGMLNGFSSVAGALLRRAVPAVVAMQYRITDRAALEFSRTFYEELAHEPSVERCVTRARRAIRMALRESLEWGTPVLSMRSPDGVLFDRSDAATVVSAGAGTQGGYAGVAGSAKGPHVEDAGVAASAEDASAGDSDEAGQVPDSHAAELEDLYTDGLDALYTKRWDEAVHLFEAVQAANRDFRDVAGKLQRARRGQRLAMLYDAAQAALAAGRWDDAIGHLKSLVEIEPGYRDAQRLLASAPREREIAQLRAEAAALHSKRK